MDVICLLGSFEFWLSIKVFTDSNKQSEIKMESTRKMSNFNSQWTKTLYQNNLKNIAFFYTFFKA